MFIYRNQYFAASDVLFILILIPVKISSAQLNCRNDWASHGRCMKSHEREFRQFIDMTSYERAEMRSQMRDCYLKQNCKSPFTPDSEANTKSFCYNQIKSRIKSTMQSCVSKQFGDYTLPADNDAANGMGNDMLNMRASRCTPEDPLVFGKCLASARGSKGANPQFKNISYCQVRFGCYRQVSFRESCYTRAQQIRKVLCQCSGKLPMLSFGKQYKDCLHQFRLVEKNTSEDYNLVLLEHVNKTQFKRFCDTSYQDPCGGFKGSTLVTRAPKTALAPPSDEKQAKASSDISSNPTPVDFGSLMSSGASLFPSDPQELATAAGLGQIPAGWDTSSFNLSQLFGQSFDISQFLSSFDMQNILSLFSGGSGAAGGLGSLGNGLDLSSLFGSVFNPSVLTGEVERKMAAPTTTILSTVQPTTLAPVGS